MNDRMAMLGLLAMGTAALHGSPADAQAGAGSQDLQIYGGEMFGDRLTETPLSGRHPFLNDDAVFGGRYTYDFTDQWGVQSRTLMPYTEVGVGYAWANLDHPLYGDVEANPLTLTDSNGYTANVGFGAKYYMTSNFFVDFDARYRYLSRLINNESQALNTGETTLGLGYQF